MSWLRLSSTGVGRWAKGSEAAFQAAWKTECQNTLASASSQNPAALRNTSFKRALWSHPIHVTHPGIKYVCIHTTLILFRLQECRVQRGNLAGVCDLLGPRQALPN